MQCSACGQGRELKSGDRIGFRDECESCGADLHCCRNCVHHDPSAYNECREPNAEWVSDRERANRCEYFSPAEGGPVAGCGKRESARDALDSLFRKK